MGWRTVAVAALLFGGYTALVYQQAYHAGGADGRTKVADMQASLALAEQMVAKARSDAVQRLRSLEADYAKRVGQLVADYNAQEREHAAQDAAAAADYRAGIRRLRLKVSACEQRGAGTGAATGRVDGAAVADIDPATGATLRAITAYGDQAIRQLTKLQEWAQQAYALCGQAEPHD